jgi:hypothetical protein
MYHLSPCIVALPNTYEPPLPGIRAKIGYVTHFKLKPISEKSRRGVWNRGPECST